MAARLRTDPTKLPIERLEAETLRVIAAATEAQFRGTAKWIRNDDLPRHLMIDGVVFIPDDTDASSGFMGAILSVVAVIVSTVLWYTSAGTVMQVLAVLLGVVGVYGVVSGLQAMRAARTNPRVSGIYLFDDAMVQVTQYGCRSIPRANVERFEYSSGGTSRPRLVLHYADDEGGTCALTLMYYRDATELLSGWAEAD